LHSVDGKFITAPGFATFLINQMFDIRRWKRRFMKYFWQV